METTLNQNVRPALAARSVYSATLAEARLGSVGGWLTACRQKRLDSFSLTRDDMSCVGQHPHGCLRHLRLQAAPSALRV